MRALWSVAVSNTKTGPIPTQWVGATEADTWASCEGCMLRPDAGGGCYAWGGNTRRGANSVRRAAASRGPDAGTLTEALARAPRAARAVRLGAIGDPARLERTALLSDVAEARAAGLRVLAYTHHWRNEPRTGALKNTALASCETLEGATEATSRGWLVALAGPASAPGFITCPNSRRPEVTCNACTLCDVPTLRRTGKKGIVFPAHGASMKRLPLAASSS